MAVQEVEKAFARKAGRMAARTGRPLASCPYDPDGHQAVLALAFVRGWRSYGEATGTVTKAAKSDGELHTGAMVALVPSEVDARRLAVDGGEPVDELHVTLRYLGKAVDFTGQSKAHLIENVREYVKQLPTFTAEAFNVAIFNPTGDEPCITLGLGGEDILSAHNAVAAAIEDYGADLPEPHKPFVPHLTLIYTDDVSLVEQLVDRVGPITFDRVRVAFGGVVTDIPLTAEPAITKAAEPGAGGADPKGEIPPDQRWPGWEQDLALAAAAAAAIAAAMAAGLTTTAASALASDFLHWARSWTAGTPIPDVRGWLQATTDLPERIEQAITGPIVDAWTQGYMVGERSASAVLALLEAGESPRAAVSVHVDWAGWQPGDVAAARRIMAEDGSIEPFQALLRDFGITIKRIAANRLDEIAAVLADGLELGKSADQIAQALTGVVNDPKWAYKVAITETNRALSAASLDSYESAGIVATSWMTALDQRVCAVCFENEFEAPGVVRVVPLGMRYPSGDLHPPGHPHCRCAPVPVLEFEMRDLGKRFDPDQPRHGKGTDQGGRWRTNWASRLADALTGQDALDAAPATLKRAPGGHGGNYDGEELTAPAGHGAVRALSEYEGLEYGPVNGYLRHGLRVPAEKDLDPSSTFYGFAEKFNQENAERVAEIDKTMAVSKLQAEVRVERVIKNGLGVFGERVWWGDVITDTKDFDQQDREYEAWQRGDRPDLTGAQWVEHAYVSTTADPAVVLEFGKRWTDSAFWGMEGEPVIMTIIVPAGVGGVQLAEMGHAAEILLERGLSMEVVADNGIRDGFRRIDVRVVTGDDD